MQSPLHLLDLAAGGLLPADWEQQVASLADGPERVAIEDPLQPPSARPPFSVVDGTSIRARLGWLWNLYLGPIRAFVGERFDCTAYPANRVSASITLNILDGVNAEHDWHTDANWVTGVLFASTPGEPEGGALELRLDDGSVTALRPRAGLFACFPGRISHRVTPLLTDSTRLSFPMVYYDDPSDQPFASEHDRHEMSHA